MRLRWLPAAFDDFRQIDAFLRRNRPAIAHRTVCGIYDSILELRDLPFLGRIGPVEGTRELVLVPLPYLVTYRLRDDVVEILAIRHGAQDFPRP